MPATERFDKVIQLDKEHGDVCGALYAAWRSRLPADRMRLHMPE